MSSHSHTAPNPKFAPSDTADSPIEPSEFRIQTQTEILAYLRILQAQACRIDLRSPNGQGLGARLIAIDEKASTLAFESFTPLIADSGEIGVQALLNGNEVTAVAYLDQVRLQFDLDGLMLVSGKDKDSELRAPWPSQMYRFQRRQAFRVRPNTRTPHVKLIDPAAPDQELRLRILDVSLGGVALLLPPEVAPVPTGFEWASVQIELDRETRFSAGLRLQSARPSAEAGAGSQLGLLFVNLSTDSQLRLQRFIDQTQKLARMLSKKAT
ncbi:flagellar regulator YcgR PilZN domain-containing protein [Paucibacter sp. AS339]|uniref:flagellar brake protein n=1 Tax=Paucibacter hankyongi TaxID=3133434 RepID=UPI0030A4E77A